MQRIQTILRKRLEDARRVAVLAVGSELRGDDVGGLLVAEKLIWELKLTKPRIPLRVFLGHTAPENLTGEIKAFQPSHILIVDAADTGRPVGHVELIEPDAPTLNASGCTHVLPLSVLARYLRGSIGCDVMILGIQPGLCTFGRAPSAGMCKAAKRLAGAILAALNE